MVLLAKFETDVFGRLVRGGLPNYSAGGRSKQRLPFLEQRAGLEHSVSPTGWSIISKIQKVVSWRLDSWLVITVNEATLCNCRLSDMTRPNHYKDV